MTKYKTPFGEAIKAINPNAQFVIYGDDKYEDIIWLHGTLPISQQDIENKCAELDITKAHVYPRVNAYPSIQDQLDMMYNDKVNGTSTWQDAIAKVKSDFPKA